MRSVDAAGLGIGDDYPPRIMGVCNLSPESPYDPSVFDDPGEAAAYIEEKLLGEGADIVDIGLESANKRFETMSAAAELDRLETAIEVIESVSADGVFSIETRYAAVADAALDRGFDMVNDVCGFADPEMPRVCEAHDAAVVKMASPPDLDRPGAIEDVDGIYDALARGGLTERTILDPAFGGWSAGKTTAIDRETFRRLGEFRALGRPLLVSINRKNFVREIAGRSTEEALPASLGATAMAVAQGAHVVRTHDVAETRDAALVGTAFGPDRVAERGRGVTVEELAVGTSREAGRYFDRIGADADPEEAVMTVFEIRGLEANARESLAGIAVANGAILVSGRIDDERPDGRDSDSTDAAGYDGADYDRDGAGDDTEDALLIGTAAALRRVVAMIDDREGDTGDVRAVADALRTAIE